MKTHIPDTSHTPPSVRAESTVEKVRLVEADSEIRKLLKDRKLSNFKKYVWLTSGHSSLFRFFVLEFCTIFLSGLRGAMGIFLRQRFYPWLFESCGEGVVFGRNVTVRHPHRIRIGKNVVIDDDVVLDAKGDEDVTLSIADGAIIGRNSILVCKGGTIEIQENVNISVNCTIISETNVLIESKTLVAGHCYIIAGGNHGMQLNGIPFVDQPRTQKGGVLIRENCWLGAHATVLDGTTIGPDSVVGAAALVTRDVPEKTLVAGVPAKVVPKDSSLQSRRVAR